MKEKTGVLNWEWYKDDKCPQCGTSLAFTTYQGEVLKEQCRACGWIGKNKIEPK